MKTLALTTVLLGIAAESPGFAQPIIVEDAGLPTAIVSLADLNLDSNAGRKARDERIQQAAELLCIEPGKTDLGRVAVQRDCYRTAMASARLQVRTFDRAANATAAVATVSLVGR
jgi:UrcA family protein